ncbi:hypothetical protein BLNAU_2540 [Blattamonas nauphoetae]|uniref:Uncharacterized protein n=1 Tax=Blattamonas nauphoetae TaxID=2049346 RepID=A0ABQ9YET5_9EUKA|nr:hypothetical protein BLNAU_2540 [Blattamonas nauphoetae]
MSEIFHDANNTSTRFFSVSIQFFRLDPSFNLLSSQIHEDNNEEPAEDKNEEKEDNVYNDRFEEEMSEDVANALEDAGEVEGQDGGADSVSEPDDENSCLDAGCDNEELGVD